MKRHAENRALLPGLPTQSAAAPTGIPDRKRFEVRLVHAALRADALHRTAAVVTLDSRVKLVYTAESSVGLPDPDAMSA